MFRWFRRKTQTQLPTFMEHLDDVQPPAFKHSPPIELYPVDRPDLKPCPFCNGYAQEVTIVGSKNTPNNFSSYIQCSVCGARTKESEVSKAHDPYPMLMELWNRRVDAIPRQTTSVDPDGPALRAILAKSDLPCIYCRMPKAHMEECGQLTGKVCPRAMDIVPVE